MKRVHTKIVCTIGKKDKRDSLDFFLKLLENGMNVARINMSHSPHFRDEGAYIPNKTYKSDSRLVKKLRKASRISGKPLAILADLMGPKIRIGYFKNDGVRLEKGNEFTLLREAILGDSLGVYIENFNEISDVFKSGSMFLFSDGLLRMRAKSINKDNGTITMEILDSGFIRSRQGVVIKGMEPKISSFTDKDREDLKFLVDAEVDFIALSYIKSASDVREIRGRIAKLAKNGKFPAVIAKIETAEAVDDIYAIINESDGVMVARGDMGMRLDVESVPILQKEIIHACNIIGKPVITATQMLESMIERPFPTRAEATDVANAIFDGTDAVMLSGETAVGAYPIESLCVMRDIAIRTEEARARRTRDEFHQREWRKRIEKGIEELKTQKAYPCSINRGIADSITLAIAEMAEDLDIAAIMTLTTSGQTAKLMSRFRANVPIIAPIEDDVVGRNLILCHGVFPVLINKKKTAAAIFREAAERSIAAGLLKPNDLYISTSGYPLRQKGSTNALRVMKA